MRVCPHIIRLLWWIDSRTKCDIMRLLGGADNCHSFLRRSARTHGHRTSRRRRRPPRRAGAKPPQHRRTACTMHCAVCVRVCGVYASRAHSRQDLLWWAHKTRDYARRRRRRRRRRALRARTHTHAGSNRLCRRILIHTHTHSNALARTAHNDNDPRMIV